MTVDVEAGAILQTVRQEAEDRGRLLPVSLAAEGTLGIVTAAVSRLVALPRESGTGHVNREI
jgi:FAD/FMN-containing dehydrogenase